MNQIYTLAKTKTVILISHRLANVVKSDDIYVFDKGNIVEHGNHKHLLTLDGCYTRLWNTQQNIENFVKAGENA